jgi:hypothetical protein
MVSTAEELEIYAQRAGFCNIKLGKASGVFIYVAAEKPLKEKL